MNRVIDVYNSFSFVFIARMGLATAGNSRVTGSNKWSSFKPIFNNDKHVYKKGAPASLVYKSTIIIFII